MGDIKIEHNHEVGITIYELYDEGEKTDEVHACRVCLLTDCKLYPLVELNEVNPYVQVSGLSLHEDDGLPRSLCAECYTLLNKCMQFREKSRMGYQCLKTILEKHSQVNVDMIKKVDRKKFKLNSNLTMIQKKPDFDYQFVDESDALFDENKIKQEQIVEYNTYSDDYHLNAMNDDTKDSTEYDIMKTLNSEIDVPFKKVKKENAKHIKSEKVPSANVVTDNVCIGIDNGFKAEPGISVIQNHNFKVKDTLKRRSTTQIKKMKLLAYKRLLKNNFTIKALSYEEQKQMMCKRKSTDNYIKSAYKCDYCFRGFNSQLTYNDHMMKHSEKSGKFLCDVCHKRCTSKSTIQTHMPSHTHLYSCVSCSFTTQNRGAAKLHLEWHKGKQYKCKVCEMVFSRSSSLKTHLRIKHPTDHVCHLCGYSFVGKVGLNAHCRLKHRLDSREVSSDSPQCTECDIKFISQSALETHLLVSLRHNSLENLKRNESCSGVNESVQKRGKIGKGNRSKREAIKDGKKVTCKECGVQFRSQHALLLHTGWKHPTSTLLNIVGRGLLCDVCGRSFHCAALLRDHVLLHSESSSYSCKVCSKSFKTPLSLQRHTKSHMETYSCPRCDKSFNCRSNRDRHLTHVHSDTKDVKCNFCEKLFKTEQEKKNHTDHVHLKKPWPKRNRHRAKDGQTIARSESGKGTTNDFCAEQVE